MRTNAPPGQVDEWIWGRERVLWGFDPAHRYTFKVLEPKRGRLGCLSLQYHEEKSESWLVWSGTAWVMTFLEGRVCTRLMRRGEGLNLGCGVVHRLMAVSDDLLVLEPSTPDKHAADKSQPKDVKRLDCVHGRPVDAPRSADEARLVERAREITEEAIGAIEGGTLPPEYEPELIFQHGGFALPSIGERKDEGTS